MNRAAPSFAMQAFISMLLHGCTIISYYYYFHMFIDFMYADNKLLAVSVVVVAMVLY